MPRKTIFLVKGEQTERHALFCNRVVDQLAMRLVQQNTRAVKVTMTRDNPPDHHLVRFEDELMAAISVAGDGDYQHVLAGESDVVGVYQVDGARLVAPEKMGQVGELTEGIGVLMLFQKKERLPEAQFDDYWKNVHSHLVAKVYPVSNYCRNRVVSAANGSLAVDGIVELQFPGVRQLLNPVQMFGGFPRAMWQFGQLRMSERRFMATSSVRRYMVDELWLKY